jgi:hypothetical protein
LHKSFLRLLNLKLLEDLPYLKSVVSRENQGRGQIKGTQQATMSETPIACTLSAGDYRGRLAQIAALARDALRSYEKDGLVLHLSYDAAAAERVREMVRREQDCCAFLTFELQEEGEEIAVTISAPEEARIAAETMFDQFITPAGDNTRGPARVALACACAAAACGAACVAPLALPAVVLAGMGTMLAWLAGAHSWMTGLATLAVAAAWLWICWQANRSGARPASATLWTMGVATLLLALSLVWPLVEPAIAEALGR